MFEDFDPEEYLEVVRKGLVLVILVPIALLFFVLVFPFWVAGKLGEEFLDGRV